MSLFIQSRLSTLSIERWWMLILCTNGRCTTSVSEFHVCWSNAGNAVSTLAFHTAGQPHLSATFWSLVVLFSLGTCRSVCVFFPIKFPCVGLVFSDIYSRPIGRGGSRGFARTPCWPPKHFIYTTIVHFKCPTGPLVVSLILRITAVQPSLVVAMRVCS